MSIRLAFDVTFRGLAQLAFAESPLAGALVLFAIACLSPWGAFAAIIGTLWGTAAGFWRPVCPRESWLMGLSGYNPAIIGILWGGFFLSGRPDAAEFAAALIICVALDTGLRRLLAIWQLPVLSMPAVITAYLAAIYYASHNQWFWLDGVSMPLGRASIVASAICIVAAMATVSVPATIQTVVLSLISAVLAARVFDVDIMVLWGLWAFTVAPANFAIQAIFIPDPKRGQVAGFFAAILGALIWSIWVFGGFVTLPPLLAPFILATWVTMVLFRFISR